MSVCQRLRYTSVCQRPKLPFEKGLKCSYKLPEEENVTFEVR